MPHTAVRQGMDGPGETRTECSFKNACADCWYEPAKPCDETCPTSAQVRPARKPSAQVTLLILKDRCGCDIPLQTNIYLA